MLVDGREAGLASLVFDRESCFLSLLGLGARYLLGRDVFIGASGDWSCVGNMFCMADDNLCIC